MLLQEKHLFLGTGSAADFDLMEGLAFEAVSDTIGFKTFVILLELKNGKFSSVHFKQFHGILLFSIVLISSWVSFVHFLWTKWSQFLQTMQVLYKTNFLQMLQSRNLDWWSFEQILNFCLLQDWHTFIVVFL